MAGEYDIIGQYYILEVCSQREPRRYVLIENLETGNISPVQEIQQLLDTSNVVHIHSTGLGPIRLPHHLCNINLIANPLSRYHLPHQLTAKSPTVT